MIDYCLSDIFVPHVPKISSVLISFIFLIIDALTSSFFAFPKKWHSFVFFNYMVPWPALHL